MGEKIFFEQTETVNTIISIVEIFFIMLYTFYTFIKFTMIKENSLKDKVIIIFGAFLIAVLAQIIREKIGLFNSKLFMIMFFIIINMIIFKKEKLYSIVISIISFGINEALYTLAGLIAFIPNAIFRISNDYIGSFSILFIYSLLIYLVYRTKKLKYGIDFLQNKFKNPFISLSIINICMMILFLKVFLQNAKGIFEMKIFSTIILLLISIVFLIKQAFDLEYKQKLLEKDLKETKEELEAKKKEVEKLEKENLEFSKTSHSLAHKQKALEYRLSQLTKIGKINEDEEKDIKKELENISQEIYKEPEEIELSKTDIASIDNMFSYMQSECIKDNIKFELQVVGNIHYMIKNLISENELEILIADHIKDAIIAINHSDNSNRSILVRVGKMDNVYSLFIYDSGIGFTKEVLDNLGKKPITTHADTGGTGMGFMNTFDTLNKTKGSLIINEIGKPCEDNYTKVLIFKFDNVNAFKVNSYKDKVVV